MEFVSAAAAQRYADLVQVAPATVVALDFDGTLAPIVPDPLEARIHPGAGQVLRRLAGRVAVIAVVTGRPAQQALALGDLVAVGQAITALGKQLHVIGHYGAERWTAPEGPVLSLTPPAGLVGFAEELPGVLAAAQASDAYVEDKGLAIAVHTRRLADPEPAFQRLLPGLARLAQRHGLVLEPGRLVIEARAAGHDKGRVLTHLAEELHAGGVLFVGDDLGDLEAFRAVAGLRDAGLPTLLVCSTTEPSPLQELADVVVDGPDGVLAVLAEFAADATAA